VLEHQDGTKTNSQAKVQNEINLHNQERKQLMQVECKWRDKFNKDNLKHKFYISRNFYEEAPLLCL
jgi:hypothetical protein